MSTTAKSQFSSSTRFRAASSRSKVSVGGSTSRSSAIFSCQRTPGYRCTKILRTEVVTSGPSIALRDGETTRPMSSSASERGSAGSAVDRQRLAVIAPW